jgi:AraC-like DNA-binding protein
MATDLEPRPRGLLDSRAGRGRYEESLHPAPADLADLVACCWHVRWDLRGREPHRVEVLPSPSAQLVLEAGQARVHGVGTERYVNRLRDAGAILGVAFRPAGFRPFAGAPLATLTDRVVPASAVLGSGVDALAGRLAPPGDVTARVEAVLAFIRRRLPPPDPAVAAVNRVVDEIVADHSLVRVDEVARRAGTGVRTLQRLFREYVGVSPKWVIRRYRLHEAAERLAGDGDVDLAGLALELGYVDQAHFARDFRSVVGRSPAAYGRDSRQVS